ncbi:MAG: phosphatidylserine/phosphatidylglycerophosphate/cardiolipin synthase family protein [Immundisolibacter sp.]|uniref:phospholipase D-like domain-containing protein n=1 Tax=Immundisolibacter sp. TaxID=1934948 RepID=UPI003D0EA048
MSAEFTATLAWLALALQVALGLLCAWHALISKRDPRSALAWIGISLLLPLGGPLLYFLFGVNRIRTRGRRLGTRFPLPMAFDYEQPDDADLAEPAAPGPLDGLPAGPIARASARISRRQCLPGNRIEHLHNGEQAYPAMVEAIRSAERYVYLSTYIFGVHGAARDIVEALCAARRRGVTVCVLIDGLGHWYTLARAAPALRRGDVRVALFLPLRLWPPSLHVNLRNHRKILVVDGEIAFTGGMNIADYHVLGDGKGFRVADLHLRLTGPVVSQIESVFAEDWQFATGQTLPDPKPARPNAHGAACRVITDGPNEDLDRLALVLLAAVSAAQRRIAIVTPYFLPSRELVGALQAAALRGVAVSILLPGRNNLPYVHWATRNMLWELLQHGVEVRYQPPPFVHTKVLLVDDDYAQVGSANLDPRSLRLNFELNVEVFDADFNAALGENFATAWAAARPVTLDEISGRGLAERTRDAACWLFSPYL